MSDDSSRKGPHALPETRWTLVARAAADRTAVRVPALDDLLSSYIPALKAHLVYNMRMAPDRAEDMVQAFVEAKVLREKTLEQADQAKGRFRNFLLRVFSNYVISQIRKEKAQKRAPEKAPVSLSEFPDMIAEDPELERSFDVTWAQQMLDEVCRRMREECEEKQREDIWLIFEKRLVGPILYGAEPMDYDELVREFGFESPAQASNVLITAKRMFKRILTNCVRETVANEEQVDAEIDDLKSALLASH